MRNRHVFNQCPEGGITVMNHCVHLEWMFVYRAFWPQCPIFTMEQENIQRRDWGWLNRLLGAIGIPRNNPMAISAAVDAQLQNQGWVHFFPEGVLTLHSQKPQPFVLGAAWFALKNSKPLVPIAEKLTWTRFHQWVKWWPPKVELIFGPPLWPQEYATKEKRLRNQALAMTADAQQWIHSILENKDCQKTIQSHQKQAVEFSV
ncbi:MAG: 1-acyl-sn-glycerol-3-phosphate acyltransferase [Spirochaetales bacterium]|nr:1-acyl-sn-glycerol-3-phosphate acyltransferase [Spirochaetales bacterium]